ncbi:MAG: hypothetical protein INQ03_05470 [Candidatus Heimdallarchaeota archaeon]|nr:hypothetical protein [Candidatus Heimdallarchaeota archaeon]
MRNTILNIHDYLAAVRAELTDFPDKESIVNELHNYIFDLANNISLESGKSVELSFIDALQQLEDPKTLAENFKEENETPITKGIPIDPTPVNVPEKKLESRDLMFMGFGALIMVSMIMGIINSIFGESVFTNIVGTFFQILIVLALLVLVIYYRDEKEFKKQLQNLRRKFEFKEVKIKEGKFTLETRDPKKKNTMWQALGAHFEGFLGSIFIIFTIIMVFIATFQNSIFDFEVTKVFNSNWYYTGFIAVIIMLFAELGINLMQMVYGMIREIRIVRAISSLVSAIGNIVLAIYYPFSFSNMFIELKRVSGVEIWPIDSIDYFARIIIIISAGYQLMMFMNHIFKYATWEPKDKKSLLDTMN